MWRSLAWAVLILLLLHLAGVGGLVGWMAATDRLSRERVVRVVDLFTPTLAAEQADLAEAADAEAAAEDAAREAARLEAVAQGPKTLQERLVADEAADELTMHRVERLHRETEDLRRQIGRAQDLLARQKAQIEAERAAFEAYVQETTRRMQDEDFRQAVQMYEQLKPDQTKAMFQQLLAEGRQADVVAYLAAMQLRKATKVLAEFEAPGEIEQATELVEALRTRGVYPRGGTMAEAQP